VQKKVYSEIQKRLTPCSSITFWDLVVPQLINSAHFMKPDVSFPYCKQEQSTSPCPDLKQIQSVSFRSSSLRFTAICFHQYLSLSIVLNTFKLTKHNRLYIFILPRTCHKPWKIYTNNVYIKCSLLCTFYSNQI
jgi:hypothetical protein